MGISLKTKLIIAGVCLVLILIIAFLIYRSGKKSGMAEGSINLSNPGQDGNNTTAQSSLAELKSLAQVLYDDMKGGTLYHDTDQWNRALILSDADFIRLYNEFDLDFQKESGDSLKQFVENETSIYGTKWNNTKDILLQRMTRLNLV